MWDADQYLKFADERSRPFFDLLAQVRHEQPKLVVDLGCGPGHLTRAAADRWPRGLFIGVDNSANMLAQARPLTVAGHLEFELADIESWTPPQPVDVILSNAALQWVRHHDLLLPRLAGMLAPGGTLAVQVPDFFHMPAHAAIDAAASEPEWADKLREAGVPRDSVQPLDWYVHRLIELGFAVNAWQTTYYHVLRGENAVLEWFKGSALRPFLALLDDESAAEFLGEVNRRLKAAYPITNGVTLLPFVRLFFVATR
ncbi:MAG TPA: methyltransferase domain-containing protein [Pirellulaceae bacterium]|nr:methyltransferase domain-containing protein [Pirellulaceae bacterium]